VFNNNKKKKKKKKKKNLSKSTNPFWDILFQSGLFFNSKISIGEWDNSVWVPENGIISKTPIYNPRDPPVPEGREVWIEITG
jgi:hypothetical protein